jgi:hypothetical protein
VEWKILQLANIKQINRNGSNTNPYTNGVIVGAQASHNTITMGNIQPLTSLTLSNLSVSGGHAAWDIFSNTENVKKYEVFETTEDILALSVTWHRLRPLISHGISNIVNPSNRPTKLTDSVLFKEMIQEDRDKANVIRDYYSKKLMMFTLKGQQLTSYRKDLNTFIHGDCKVVKEEMMPLVYRLPEFYEYDVGLDEMFLELDTRFEGSQIASSTIKTLNPVKKFTVKRKSRKFVEYWLRDNENKPYKIEIDTSNELMHLWDYFYDRGKFHEITLDTVIRFSNRDSVSHYKLIKWKLA